MMEGNCQGAETLRMASVKSHSRLMKRMPVPAFARLKRFHAILDQSFDNRAYSGVERIERQWSACRHKVLHLTFDAPSNQEATATCVFL